MAVMRYDIGRTCEELQKPVLSGAEGLTGSVGGVPSQSSPCYSFFPCPTKRGRERVESGGTPPTAPRAWAAPPLPLLRLCFRSMELSAIAAPNRGILEPLTLLAMMTIEVASGKQEEARR